MEEALQFFCDKIIWGLPVVVFIVLSGVVFGIRLRGRFFAGPKKLKAAFRAQSTDGLRPIDAFTLTTGGKIGVGNVVGVALALKLGGPGALLWIAVFAAIGAALAYAECFTAARMHGAPPDYMRAAGWKIPAVIYLIAMFSAQGAFMPAIQVNSLTQIVCDHMDSGSTTALLLGIGIAVTFLLCVRLGPQRIGRMSTLLLPLAALLYVVISLGIIAVNYQRVPTVLLSVVEGALSPKAILSGAAGSALWIGIRRGMFSSEAGYGIASYAAAAANGTAHQIGIVQSFSVIFDAGICLMTGLMLLCADRPEAAAAFYDFFGEIGWWALIVVIVLLVFTTLLACAFTVITDIRGKHVEIKRVFAMVGMFLILIGSSVTAPSIIWSLCDIVSGVMAILNISVLWKYLFSGKTRELYRSPKEPELPESEPKQ